MDISNNNPNFEFNVNLTGIRAASGGGTQLPEGYYQGVISDCFGVTASTGRAQVAIKVSIKGEYEGVIRTTRLGIPKDENDGVRYFWRALFEAAGYTPAQIDSGIIGVKREVLMGRDVTFYYKPGDKDAGIYEDFKFLAPHDWSMQQKAWEASKHVTAAAIGATTAPAMTATTPAVSAPAGIGTNGGNAINKDSLMAALNR
jgi:hypothetical protein